MTHGDNGDPDHAHQTRADDTDLNPRQSKGQGKAAEWIECAWVSMGWCWCVERGEAKEREGVADM